MIQCLVLSKKKVPQKPMVELCRKLFKVFAKNKVLRRSKPVLPGANWLTIVLMDKARARQLNKKYRRKDYATDVLSFAPEEKGVGLGELVLCEPVVRRQAKEHGISFKKELDYLIIHGFLHLLGYDH